MYVCMYMTNKQVFNVSDSNGKMQVSVIQTVTRWPEDHEETKFFHIDDAPFCSVCSTRTNVVDIASIKKGIVVCSSCLFASMEE